MRRFTILLIALAIVMGTPAAAGCLKCAVKVYVKALNDHDTEKALSYVAEGLRFVAPDTDMTLDRAALQRMLGWDAATNSQIRYDELQWDGKVVNGRFTERNDFYELLGITERSYNLTFHFEDELIREIHLTNDAGPKMSVVLEPFLRWAGARHAGVLEAIYPEGQFVFDEQSAEQWLTLLRKWGEEIGGPAQAQALPAR